MMPIVVRSFLLRLQHKKMIKEFMAQRRDFYSDLARAILSKEEPGDWLRKAAIRLKKSQPLVAIAFTKIHGVYVEKGLAEALTGFIPESEITIISAAHLAGALPENLRLLANTVKKREKLKTVMRMTAGMSAATGGLEIFNLWQIAEQIVPVMTSIGGAANKLTGAAYWTYMVAYMTTSGGPYLLIILLALIFLYFKYLPSWVGPKRRWCDSKFTVFRMYQEYESAMFMLAYSTLKSAKTGDREAIVKIAKTSTPWLRWHCNTIHNRLVQYGLTAKTFATGLFSPRIADRLSDLCERGSFDSAVKEIGEDVLEETLESLLATANRIELLVGAFSTGILVLVTFALPPIIEVATRQIVNFK